jgi:hypothetical protein
MILHIHAIFIPNCTSFHSQLHTTTSFHFQLHKAADFKSISHRQSPIRERERTLLGRQWRLGGGIGRGSRLWPRAHAGRMAVGVSFTDGVQQRGGAAGLGCRCQSQGAAFEHRNHWGWVSLSGARVAAAPSGTRVAGMVDGVRRPAHEGQWVWSGG